ncbi:MAG: hypothetical protein IJW84_00980 [Alphaproteobacteria bacterium]|nr:hypothetical protein [Alphaproteobacteria bacterium]
MTNKLLLSIAAISCVCTSAHAWNSADITCTKNQYTAALSACKTNCNKPCLSSSISGSSCEYSIVADDISVCACITAGYSADNCVALMKTLCSSDGEPSASYGKIQNWITRQWSTVTNTCNASTTYRCNAGYYSATDRAYDNSSDANGGCNACPGNATCPGGMEQANVYCNQGYVAISSNAIGAGCRACATTGVYTDSTLTTAATATTAGPTLISAATDSAACYLPAGTYYDASGKFTISANGVCMY